MKVHWTRTAENHLGGLHGHISRDSPEYAKRMVDRLTARSQQIAGFPSPGRRVPEFDAEQIREVIEALSGSSIESSRIKLTSSRLSMGRWTSRGKRDHELLPRNAEAV